MRWISRTTKKDYFFPACFLNNLCINHTPIGPATKAIIFHVCSATNPPALSKKLRMVTTTLPTATRNASAAFLASLLSASANLSNHFFETLSFFAGEPPPSHSPPLKTSVKARTIVEIASERAVTIEIIVMRCSRNKVRILSANSFFLLYQKPFQGFV